MASSGLTPVRMRGAKRKKLKAQRAGFLDGNDAPQLASAVSFRASPLADIQQRFRTHKFSLIELLPLEILEQIFIESENIDFANATHILGRSLSSKYCFFKYLSRVTLIHKDTCTVLPGPLQQLVSCRWFSLAVLDEWMFSFKRAKLSKLGKDCRSDTLSCIYHGFVDLGFSEISLPLRVLKSEWSDDNAELLIIMAGSGVRIFSQDYVRGQLALEAVYAALRQQQPEILMSILLTGTTLEPFATNIVRFAVTEAPFDPEVVSGVISWAETRPGKYNRSDEALMRWAISEEAKKASPVIRDKPRTLHLAPWAEGRQNEGTDGLSNGTWLLRRMSMAGGSETPSEWAKRTMDQLQERAKAHRLRRLQILQSRLVR